MLSSRTETILRSTVEQYIAKAIPVSSQTIVNEYDLEISSATIRNEMARLEEEGYITRPHSSAGSVPLDKGYRYYVDTLGDIYLPLDKQRLVNHLFHQVEQELEKWLNLAATLIAQLVQDVAIVTTPRLASCQFKYLELVTLHDSVALLILILRGAKAKQQLISFDQAVSQVEMVNITNKLNAAYAGLTSRQILNKGIELSPSEQQTTDYLVNMMKNEDKQDNEELFLYGLHFILNQPEFSQQQRAQALMELVEYKNLLKSVIPAKLNNKGIQVIIGKENKAEAVHDYSVVITQYGLPQEAIGTICVIGPTRMHYAHAIATVNHLSLVLNRMVTELYESNNINE
ncbi:MAG: heat-inducible transcriptional repressor HrcA [Dehalococcoidales bacterium]|nr:heat-inducible transcriptional repressor HrcA [Dehalococcoidales bacterium]